MLYLTQHHRHGVSILVINFPQRRRSRKGTSYPDTRWSVRSIFICIANEMFNYRVILDAHAFGFAIRNHTKMTWCKLTLHSYKYEWIVPTYSYIYECENWLRIYNVDVSFAIGVLFLRCLQHFSFNITVETVYCRNVKIYKLSGIFCYSEKLQNVG